MSYFNKALETMSPEKRKAYQLGKLREALFFGYERSPAIREKFEGARIQLGEIHSIKDLEKIPITRKHNLPELQRKEPPFGGFLTVPENQLKRIFVSPGPIYDPQGQDEDFWGFAQAFYAAGLRRGDRVINTFSYHLTPAGFVFEEALQTLGCTTIPTGPGNTETQIRIIYDLGVRGYIGTPTFLMNIMTKGEEMGYPVKKDLPLKVAVLSVEILAESMRIRFEEEFGVRVGQCYGTADLGCLGYECSEKRGFHIPERVIVEMVDPGTGRQLGPGEPGEIVATLFNKTYPLIRFGTGDISSYVDEICPCGRTSARLTRIIGRADQLTKVRGMFIHPHQVDQIFEKYPAVSKYRVVITRKGYQDEMTFQVELQDSRVDIEGLKGMLQEDIRQVMKLRGEVEFIPPGTLPESYKKIDDRRVWE